MRRSVIIALTGLMCVTLSASASNLGKLRASKGQGLIVPDKSRWVPVVGQSKIEMGDNIVASLFVQTGSLLEYQATGLGPKHSRILLKLNASGAESRPDDTVVIEIAYKKNPSTDQWEPYSAKCDYRGMGGAQSSRKGIKAGCTAVTDADFM